MLHNNEMVNIEEDTILGVNRSMIRRFTFHHRVNQLAVSVLTSGASLSSCKLDLGRHEIIVNQHLLFTPQPNRRTDPLNASSEVSTIEWQSHVLGTDSLLFTATSAQSVTYHLNTKNELTITGKLRNIQSMSSFYINLVSAFFCFRISSKILHSFPQNCVSPPSTIDGHYLQVSPSIPEAGIESIGDDYIDLVHGYTLCSSNLGQNFSNQKLLPGVLFESVFSLKPFVQEVPTGSPTIVAILSYQSRCVRIELQPNNQSSGPIIQTVVPKLRIRIRKEGISFTPFNMTEFKITYKLSW